MSNISKTYHIVTTAYTGEVHAPSHGEGILRQVTNLFLWFFGLLNGLIGWRFMLKLMMPNQSNPLMDAVYSITTPFIWPVEGLIPTLSFRGSDVEFCCMAAIVLYALLGWFMIQLLWLPFARIK